MKFMATILAVLTITCISAAGQFETAARDAAARTDSILSAEIKQLHAQTELALLWITEMQAKDRKLYSIDNPKKGERRMRVVRTLNITISDDEMQEAMHRYLEQNSEYVQFADREGLRVTLQRCHPQDPDGWMVKFEWNTDDKKPAD